MNMKKYIIKIEADGITYHHVISNEEDLTILKTVLAKIDKDVTKKIKDSSPKQAECEHDWDDELFQLKCKKCGIIK